MTILTRASVLLNDLAYAGGLAAIGDLKHLNHGQESSRYGDFGEQFGPSQQAA